VLRGIAALSVSLASHRFLELPAQRLLRRHALTPR
jgi:hypothetical protein